MNEEEFTSKLVGDGFRSVVAEASSNVMARRVTAEDFSTYYLDSALTYDHSRSTVRVRGNEEEFKVGDWVLVRHNRFMTLIRDDVFRMMYRQFTSVRVDTEIIQPATPSTLTKEQAVILVSMEAMGTHSFYEPDFSRRVEQAFGVKVMETITANTDNPKGLIVESVGPNTPVSGASAWRVAMAIAKSLHIHVPGMLGRGFQFKAAMDAIWAHFGGRPPVTLSD